MQREVAHDPHERWEVLGILFGVRVIVPATCLNLYIFREIDDEAQVVELGLVDRLLAVIDEVGGEEDGE